MAFSINSIGTGSSTSGSSFAITVPVGGVPAGAIIAVAVSDRATTYGSQAVTDSAGNTYTRAASAIGSNVIAAWYYAYNVSALTAGQTITITKSGTDRAAASAVYITGAASGNPLDSGATATAFSASTGQPSVTSGTPSTADCLMLAMDAVPGATATYTPDANWATPPISAETGTTGSDRQVDGGYQLLTGTPAKSFNPSYSAIPAAWAAAIIAFKPNTGGGTTESRTLSASGTGAASFGSASLSAQSFSAAGVTSASFSAGGVASASLSAAGSSATSFAGAAVAVASLSATGTAVASFVGGSDISGSAALAAAGTASVAFRSGAIVGRTLDANGSSSVQFGAAWLQTISVSFNATGIGAANFALPIVVPIDAGSATGPARDILASRARRITKLASPQRRISMLGRR